MLIDCSYFTCGPRHILNATLGKMPNPNAEEVNAEIKAYIKAFQWPFLKGVLGARAAAAVSSYLRGQDAEEGAQADASVDAVIERLREPFANYVFYKILRDSNTQATMTGLVRLKCANDHVAPIRRQVAAWNDMVEMLTDFSQWVKSSDCNVPDITTDSNFLTKINALNL